MDDDDTGELEAQPGVERNLMPGREMSPPGGAGKPARDTYP
jgi:hypothetical protein